HVSDRLGIPDARRAADRLEAAKTMTFEQCASAYLDDHRESWRNPKHRQQWENTLAAYVYPVFGALPVQAIDRQLVLQAIKPIWKTKPETANRVRGSSEGRQPGALAWQHRQRSAAALQGPQREASPCPALCRASGLHGGPTRAARGCSASARIYDPDGRPHGRDDGRRAG